MDHPDGQGARRISPRQADAPGSGEILNRAQGNNSTLDVLFLPQFLGSILTGVPTVHNPIHPAPLGWNNPLTPRWKCLRKRPASPADALMTSAAQKERHPCGGNGLKSTLRGFYNRFSLR